MEQNLDFMNDNVNLLLFLGLRGSIGLIFDVCLQWLAN